MRKPRNTVSFRITAQFALFVDPMTKTSGNKGSYPIPTYEAIKGVLRNIYGSPTIIWYVDRVRVMSQIKTIAYGTLTVKHNENKKHPAEYMMLVECEYQVEAHFEWNRNQPERAADWNENKHHNMAKRFIKKGGRYDCYLGDRSCQCYIEPCVFGEGEGYYDNSGTIEFDNMTYHGVTYPNEAYSEETRGKRIFRYWKPVMVNGVINYPRPEECTKIRVIEENLPIKAMPLKTQDC